jgi:glycosyltransferase involved in cell wall biosynthesis
VIAQPWRHVHEIAKRMKEGGHEVTIFSDTGKGLPAWEIIGGVSVSRIEKDGWLFDREKLLEALNKKDIDVINWNGSDLWSAFHLWRLRKKLSNSVVWTLHSGRLSRGDLGNLKVTEISALYQFWNNFINVLVPDFAVKRWTTIPQMKLATVLSERNRNDLRKIGFSKDIKVIRSGVETAVFNPSTTYAQEKRLELGFQENDQIVAYFGQESAFRGTDTLIEALPKILTKVPSLRLLMLIRDRSPKRIIHGNSRITRIRGNLSQEEIVQYLSLADVIVLPFKFWPQVECPLTILEAMAMAKPVVTTNIGAIPEIVRDKENGVIVRPGSPQTLADAVTILLVNKELSFQLGKNARSCVQSHYTWELAVRDTMSAFKEAIE